MKMPKPDGRPVFVDLDGVIFDFRKLAVKLVGHEFPEGSHYIWPAIQKVPRFFQDLELLPDAMELWEAMKPYNPQILTAIPRRDTMPFAEEDKRIAVAKHLGKDVVVKIGPHARDKQNHCTPGAILIDDNVINIAQWGLKGGIGIFHVNTKRTLEAFAKLYGAS